MSVLRRSKARILLVVLMTGLLALTGCSTSRAGASAAGRSAASRSTHAATPSAAPDPGPSATPTGALPVSPSTRWKVVALGDSVPAGAACHCTPFPTDYAHDLSNVRGIPTTAQNLAVDGSNSSDLLSALRDGGSATARAVTAADIDLVTIGANDFSDQHRSVTTGACGGACLTKHVATMKANLAGILVQVHRLRAGRPTAVLVTGYWNVFEDGKVARQAFAARGVRATRQLTALVNDAISDVANAHGATYVDLVEPFNGPAAKGDITHLLAADGNHPSSAGQQLIAKRLVAAGLRGLVHG